MSFSSYLNHIILLYENDVTVHHVPHFHAKAFVYSRHGLVLMLNKEKLHKESQPNICGKEYLLPRLVLQNYL